MKRNHKQTGSVKRKLVSILQRNKAFSPVSEKDFFSNVKKELPASDVVVKAITAGLISTTGEDGLDCFKRTIKSNWPFFLRKWGEAYKAGNFEGLQWAVKVFVNRIKAEDIVDRDYPLFKTIGNPQNSFFDVAVIKSLALICGGSRFAPDFLYLLIQVAPEDPLIYLNYIALSRILSEDGKTREAADYALEAKRLRAYDLCASKAIISSQKKLLADGMQPEIQTYSDFQDRFCDQPFKVVNIFSVQTEQPLKFSLCKCAMWAPVVFESDFTWNGRKAQEFRNSILDGSFRYCNELLCPSLIKNSLPKRSEITDPYLRTIIVKNDPVLEKGPEDIVLAYDRSCNLSCPSCRDQVYLADRKTTDYYNNAMDTMLPPLLTNAKNLVLSKKGEALASKHFRHLLKLITPQQYPDLKIEILTNLKAVSSKTWEELGETAKLIKILHLSIDGATKQTLEKLRRGLKWERLLNALAFLRDLRNSGQIRCLIVAFVLQKDNFRELPLMLEMCSSYCVDLLGAFRISSHGSYTADEFKEIDVGDPTNLLYSDYLSVIEETKALHKKMQEDLPQILASGGSVPYFIYRE